MRLEHLPVTVIARSENHLAAEILFAADCGFFDGHFEDFKLLPGVLQTHIAVRLFERHSDRRVRFAGVKNMKFFKPILPGTTVTLECDWEPAKAQLTFKYSVGETVYAKGVIAGKNE